MPSIQSCVLSTYAELTLATFFTAPIIFVFLFIFFHGILARIFFFLHISTSQLLDKPWSQVSFLPWSQVSSLSPPRFLPSIFIAHRVQQSHCSSIFYRVLLTHALAFSASQFVHKKESPRIYTSMHSGGFELTKLIYTRLEDNLIRHRDDRVITSWSLMRPRKKRLTIPISSPIGSKPN